MALSKRRRLIIPPIDTLDRFPVEIWLKILQSSDPVTLYHLCQVSHPLHDLITNPTNGLFYDVEVYLHGLQVSQISQQLNWDNLRHQYASRSIEQIAAAFNVDVIRRESYGGTCDFETTPTYYYVIRFKEFLHRPIAVITVDLICQDICHEWIRLLGPTLPDFKFFRPDLNLSRFDPLRYSGHLGPKSLQLLNERLETDQYRCDWAFEEQYYISTIISPIIHQTINEINHKDHSFNLSIDGSLEHIHWHRGKGYGTDWSIYNLSKTTLRKIADKLVEASEKIEHVLRQ